jgi:hypothetical protein
MALAVMVSGVSVDAMLEFVPIVSIVVPPERAIPDGKNDDDAPAGRFETVKLLTVPVNPMPNNAVIVKLAVWPAEIVADEGLADNEKLLVWPPPPATAVNPP